MRNINEGSRFLAFAFVLLAVVFVCFAVASSDGMSDADCTNPPTITYVTNGGTAIDDETYDPAGLPYTLNIDTVREGYRFIGWYESPGLTGTAVTHVTSGTGDRTFYADWVRQDVYDHLNGKVAVFYGDSITTMGGYTPTGYSVCYDKRVMDKYGISYNTTYWGALCEKIGMEAHNRAWSGSAVATHRGSHGNPSAPMASYERLNDIGARLMSEKQTGPDIIFVYAGSNDCHTGIATGGFKTSNPYVTALDTTTTSFTSFEQAYTIMLTRMMALYPNAEIVVLEPNYTLSYYSKERCDACVAVIDDICEHFHIAHYHLTDAGISVESGVDLIDGTHPSNCGFSKIYRCIASKIDENFHTATIKYNDGTADGKIYSYCDVMRVPDDPIHDGRTFAGWYADPEFKVPYDWNTRTTEDITVYAKMV